MYEYELQKHYRVKEKGEYPLGTGRWNTGTITLYPEDVLTGNEKDGFTKHNGVCRINIWLKDEQVELVEKPTKLVVS
jgi:hypothetical protein